MVAAARSYVGQLLRKGAVSNLRTAATGSASLNPALGGLQAVVIDRGCGALPDSLAS